MKSNFNTPMITAKPVRAIKRACKNNVEQIKNALWFAGIRFGVPESRTGVIQFLGTLSRPQLDRVLAVLA